MPFFHVLIADQSDPERLRCILSDLDEPTLRAEFVAPFASSKDILVDGRIYRISEIATAKIRRTERKADQELKTIQDESWAAIERFNRESDVVLISAGQGHSKDDLALAGTDVTNEMLTAAPSTESGGGVWDRYGKQIVVGVIVTVVGGAILALLALLL